MRLHHLELTAFGPFAGTATVDVDALGADGLFLLHGPTGAGKTSVLDAVAFALFGKVPGARAGGKRLRSDHAAPDVAPRVALELTVGGRRLRVVRTPEWQRPKKRGTGTTTAQATASLTWVDEAGSEGLTRIDEVSRTVEQLLGMSADQFFQVVLLPQGEFARFLRAGTDERAALLARLFDTARFHGAEEWLAARRRSTAAAAEAGRQEVAVLVGSVATAAGVGDEDTATAEDAPDDGDGGGVASAEDDPLGWATGLVAAVAADEAAALAALDEARDTARAADTELARAREHAGLLRRRDQARAALAGLAAGAADRARDAERVAAARRAEPVADAARHAADRAAAVTELDRALGAVEAALARDDDGARALAGDPARQLEAWRTEVGRLGELVALAAAAAEQAATAADLAGAVAQRDVELAELARVRDALPERRARAETALAAARRAADGLPALQQDRARAAAVAVAAAEVPGLTVAVTAADGVRRRAKDAHQEARERWLDLREARIEGIAGELAGVLELDAACVVCGSTVHPAPAPLTLQTVDQADEAVAHELEQSAHTVSETASAAHQAAVQALATAQVRSGGVDVADAERVLAELAQRCAADEALAAGLDRAVAEEAGARAEAEDLVRREQDLREQRAAAAERRDGLLAAVEAARTRLEAARGDDPDVAARRARLTELAELVAAVLEARARRRAVHEEAAGLAGRAQELAARAGFAGVTAACAAVLDPAVLTRLERAVAAARDEEAGARAVLAEPDVAALGEDAVADVDTPTAGCEAAHAAQAAAQRAHATVAHRSAQLSGLLARLTTRLQALAPVLDEADRVAALADVVAGRGQNRRKVSLHSYVLAARLEEVAVAASVRLQRMSGGRFEFVHTDAAGPRGTRGGLGLDVRDDYTGVVRAASTLSGGESFLASLSLALGLADVVAAESGGVLLDTLFIDEGFGTLDSDTLDQVMVVLDELRAGGRVVGLVSHVDELRQRIPSRLQVHRGRTGSHLEVTTG